MNILEQFTDLLAVGVGMIGSLLKSLKLKLPLRTTILSMCIAGVIAYGTIGIITLFFNQMSPKLMVLVSFSVGWVANELTTKLDSAVNDIYDILMERIKSIFSKK